MATASWTAPVTNSVMAPSMYSMIRSKGTSFSHISRAVLMIVSFFMVTYRAMAAAVAVVPAAASVAVVVGCTGASVELGSVALLVYSWILL